MKFRRSFLIAFIKKGSLFFLLLISLNLIFNRNYRRDFFSYFSTRCIDYRQLDFSRKLNDRLVDYSSAAKLSGVEPSKTVGEIKKKARQGKLVKVRSGRRYLVDRLNYSHPYVTRDTRELIDEIAKRFREKTSEKGGISEGDR
jgi:hypothetical protein